jgi:NAD-dependent deacetylase
VKDAQPNAGHLALAELENDFDVHIITQNIDDLHERAGSTSITHLHGEIFKMRSEYDEDLIYPIYDDIKPGDKAEDGAQLRPHIVWFEEPVPMIEEAMRIAKTAELFLIVGHFPGCLPGCRFGQLCALAYSQIYCRQKIPYTSSIQNLTAIEKGAAMVCRS